MADNTLLIKKLGHGNIGGIFQWVFEGQSCVVKVARNEESTRSQCSRGYQSLSGCTGSSSLDEDEGFHANGTGKEDAKMEIAHSSSSDVDTGSCVDADDDGGSSSKSTITHASQKIEIPHAFSSDDGTVGEKGSSSSKGTTHSDRNGRVHVVPAIEVSRNELRTLKSLTEHRQGDARSRFVVDLIHGHDAVDQVLIYLEFCENGDLLSLFQNSKLTVDHVTFFAAEIACALDFLHQSNVLHLDVKPENVVLTKDFHIKLIDFGFSRVIEDDGTNPVVVSSGTLHYSAPEIFQRQPCSTSMDWWSFGILLYELLFADLPFDHVEVGDGSSVAEQQYQTCVQICTQPVPYPAIDMYHSTGFDLVCGLLEKQPDDRMNFDAITSSAFFEFMNWDDLALGNLVSPPVTLKTAAV